MTLPYAPKPSWYRSKRSRRSYLVVALALLTVVAFLYAPNAIHRLRVTHAYRRCLSYQAPDAHLVYSDNADDVIHLATTAPYSTFHVGPWSAAYQTQDDPFRDLYALSNWKCWSGLAHTTAFLHERLSPGGFNALVSVTLVLYVNQPDRVLSLDVAVTPRPHVLGAPEPVIEVGRFCHLPASGQSLRVFMGQPDPNDKSRFTIDIELAGSRSKLVGILRDDGSVVMYFPKTFADFVKD